jgi:hypothetical protein
MGLFRLERDRDISRVSGTGVVAHGALFPNGVVTLAWDVAGKPGSTVVYQSYEDMCAIHLHHGATRVEWVWAQ